MRLLLILMLCTPISYGAAADTSESDNCGSGGVVLPSDATSVNELLNLANPELVQSEENFKIFISNVCTQVGTLGIDLGSTIGQRIEALILDYTNLTVETPNYKKKMGEFINKNNNRLICPGSHIHKTQHLFKRVVDLNVSQQVFYDFLLNPSTNEYKIDVNAIELVDGKKETVLDYIQKVKLTERYTVGGEFQAQVQLLEEILKDRFNAKLATELNGDSL